MSTNICPTSTIATTTDVVRSATTAPTLTELP